MQSINSTKLKKKLHLLLTVRFNLFFAHSSGILSWNYLQRLIYV